MMCGVLLIVSDLKYDMWFIMVYCPSSYKSKRYKGLNGRGGTPIQVRARVAHKFLKN